MAAGDPQQAPAGGGSLLTRKLGPLPTWGWLVIVTAAGIGFYLYQKHKQASAAQNSNSGGGPSPTVGEAFVPEFVINNQEEPPGGPPAKRPPQPKPKPGKNGDWKEITVEKDQTFAQLAQAYHWDPATIRAIASANQIAGKGQLRPGTLLHKGQVILRPIKDSSTKDTGNG